VNPTVYPIAASLVPWFRRCRVVALAVGVVASLVLAVGGLFDPAQFFRAYLAAYVFCLGLSLGSLAILMIYHTTGGAWGFLIRRFLEAAVQTLPLMAVGFVPIALGVRHLYPWAQPEEVASDPIVAGQSIYMNVPFFMARAVLYFALWLLWAANLIRLSRKQDRTRDPSVAYWLDGWSGVGLLVYGVTLHFAAVDWLMAIQPPFHSTIFGPLVLSGQLLSALALAVLVLCLLGGRTPLADFIRPKVLNDLGNLLFSFVVVWAYINWFQYMLSWIANLPYDAVWYVPRFESGWQWLALLLLSLNFAVPVLVLLWRAAKRSRLVLGSVAALVLVTQAAFSIYQAVPPFDAYGIAAHWMNLVAPFALGGLWLAYFQWRLGGMPVLAEYDYNENSAAHLRTIDDHEAAWAEIFSHG
jgi:hypothetical protein